MARRHLVGVQLDMLGGPEVAVTVPVPRDAQLRIRLRARAAGAPESDDTEGLLLAAINRLEHAGTTAVANAAGVPRQRASRALLAMERKRLVARSLRFATAGGGHELGWKAR